MADERSLGAQAREGRRYDSKCAGESDAAPYRAPFIFCEAGLTEAQSEMIAMEAIAYLRRRHSP